MKGYESFKIIGVNLYDLDFFFFYKLEWFFCKLVLVIIVRKKEGREVSSEGGRLS